MTEAEKYKYLTIVIMRLTEQRADIAQIKPGLKVTEVNGRIYHRWSLQRNRIKSYIHYFRDDPRHGIIDKNLKVLLDSIDVCYMEWHECGKFNIRGVLSLYSKLISYLHSESTTLY